MAIYHLSMKPVGRAGGRSATAAAAYRSAERIHDLTSGETFDFQRKQGVEHTQIVLPTRAAQQDINWPRDRQALWNAAEAAEKRKDARVAREYEVALPAELNKAQRLALVREFASYLADRYGVAVDIAIHRPHREGDTRNHHAHLLTTTREITATGLGAKTQIELGDKDRAKRGLDAGADELVRTRERWASLTNEHLQRLGHEARIDHRSLEAQGIQREPTIHLGPAVTALQRRGIETQVERRIAWQEQERALERLQAAAELGRIERERLQREQGILDLSNELAAAVSERDQRMGAKLTPAELQHESLQRWLALRNDPDRARGAGRGQGQGAEVEDEKGYDKEKERKKALSRDRLEDDLGM